MGNNRATAPYWSNWLPCCCCEEESYNERSSEFEVANLSRKGSRSSRTLHSRRSSHTHGSHHHSRHSSHSRHSKRSHRSHHSHSCTKESVRVGPVDYSPRFNNVERVVEWAVNGKEYKVPFRPQYFSPAPSSIIHYQNPLPALSRPPQDRYHTPIISHYDQNRSPRVISSRVIGHHYGPEKVISIYRGNERTISIEPGLPPARQDSSINMPKIATMPQPTLPPYSNNESVFRYEQEGYATDSSEDDSETFGSTSYESLLVVDEDDVTHYTEARLRDAPRKRTTAVFLKKRGLDGAKRFEKWLVLPPRD